MDVEQLPTGAVKMTLIVDRLDHEAIMRVAIERGKYPIADQIHDDANWLGRVLAEICRGYEEAYPPREEDLDR